MGRVSPGLVFFATRREVFFLLPPCQLRRLDSQLLFRFAEPLPRHELILYGTTTETNELLVYGGGTTTEPTSTSTDIALCFLQL